MPQKIRNPHQAIGAELFPQAGVDADEAAAALEPEGAALRSKARGQETSGIDLQLGFPRYLIAVNTVSGQIPNPGEIRDVDMQGQTTRFLGNIRLRLVESPAHYVAVCSPTDNIIDIWPKEAYAQWCARHPGMVLPLGDRSLEDQRLPYILHDMGDWSAIWQVHDAEGDGSEAVSPIPETGLRGAARS
jgi:hypothetical protein